jgi:hypothetical protein
VKVEDSPQPMRRKARAPQPRKTSFKNGDLPSGCQTSDAWRRAFIPTYLWWIANQEDPWVLNDEKALKAMQYIWTAIYEQRVDYTITVNGPVFSIVSQPTLSKFYSYLRY